MCIVLLRSADGKCLAKQDIYNVIFIQERALLSRCCDAVGDGSRYDPTFKLCQHATATHSTSGQQCEACTGAMQPWKGMGMREAMLNTIAENPKTSPLPVKSNEEPMAELAKADSEPTSPSSAPKKALSIKKSQTPTTSEQIRATIPTSRHATPTTAINATVNSPKTTPRLSTVDSATTAPPSLPGSEQSTILQKAKNVRATTPSDRAKSAQTAPSPAVRKAPSKLVRTAPSTGVRKPAATVFPTLSSQPSTSQKFKVTHQQHATQMPYAPQPPYSTQQPPYPTQQSPYPTLSPQPNSLKRQSENTTLRENNKRLRSGMTQLAMERATGARDIAQLLAYNERQATRIEELEAEVEGLRGRIAAVEGRRT